MPSTKRKKFWGWFFILFGLFGLGLNIYSFAIANEQNDNFKKLIGIFWMIAFLVLIYNNITKLRKLRNDE